MIYYVMQTANHIKRKFIALLELSQSFNPYIMCSFFTDLFFPPSHIQKWLQMSPVGEALNWSSL